MSIVLVCFSNAPKVSDEAVKKDAELDKHLESRVEGKKSVFSIKNAVNVVEHKTKTNKSHHDFMMRKNVVNHTPRGFSQQNPRSLHFVL